MKHKLRMKDDGRRDKGAGEGKTKLGKEDLEDLFKKFKCIRIMIRIHTLIHAFINWKKFAK